MTDKKIAILSMQRVVNFGSVLQAYSLREILRELTDATVTFMDIDENTAIPCLPSARDHGDYVAPAAYPKGILQKGKRWIIARLSARNKYFIQRFMRDQLQLAAAPSIEHYDCVVVGSDEVFNHSKGIRLQLHGGVEQTDRVISYAASCGSAEISAIPVKHRNQVQAAMEHFSGMSVRDAATQEYVKALYSGAIMRHLDPVLVGRLSQRKHMPVRIKNYLLVYAYGQRIRTAEEIDAIRKFAKDRNLKTVAMGGSQFWCDLYIPTTPLRLLDYFYHADYVVTDTFHGTIFSVINKKRFGVIVRESNCNKLTDLLQVLGLEDRQIFRMSDLEQTVEKNIDYDAVETILAQERIRTRDYLKKHLEG